MPISIMASDSLVFRDWVELCFRKEKHETRACAHSFYHDEMSSASIKQPLASITHSTFRLRRVRFYTLVGQPFLKRLYILWPSRTLKSH